MKFTIDSPTKLIISGEHAVVYGAPALAIQTPLYNRIKFEAEKSGEGIIKLKTKYSGKVKKGEWKNGKLSGDKFFVKYGHAAVINAINKIKKINKEIKIEWGDIAAPKGMGNSASIYAGIARGILKVIGKKVSDKKLFEVVQEGEKIMHGKPSGIDAKTVLSKKGAVLFKKTKRRARAKEMKIEFPKNSELLIVDTFPVSKKRSTTKEMVEKFGKINKMNNKKRRERVIKKFEKVLEGIMKELKKNGDAKKLGQLFLQNQKLLTSVSSPEIDNAINIAVKSGAYGGKLSGAGGRGGVCFVICSRRKAGEIKKALEKYGYKIYSKSGVI